MSLVIFQHVAVEGPEILGSVLQGYGHRLRIHRMYAEDSVPVDLDDCDGVISLGGPMHVDQVAEHPWLDTEKAFIKSAHDRGTPMVGIGLGAQLIAAALGGEVGAMDTPQVGWAPVQLAFPGTIDPLFAGIGWQTMQFHLHAQEVKKLPPGATPLAQSATCRTQAFKVGFTTYGFQYRFHWSRSLIEKVTRDNKLLIEGGLTADALAASTNEHHDAYRRVGERLCRMIAMLLFPIDKR